MSTEPTSSTESDNLRRSKRKKFRLDVVAAAHGNNQKKSKKDPHGMDDDSDDDDFEMSELSVQTDIDIKEEDVSDDYEGDTSLSKRRTRRSTAHWGDYQDPFVDWVDQSGPHACSKCPSRYESRSSLANHTKMHNGEKRKFACELCDFSANTQKSLMHHNNVHKRFGVLSAQTSPAIKATNGTAAGPSNSANVSIELQRPGSSSSGINNNNSSSNAPELVAAEPFEGKESGDDDDDETAPPILEREDTEEGPPMLQIEGGVEADVERESSVESVAPKIVPVVRKSTRPSKPKKSLSPVKTPKKIKKAYKMHQVKLKLKRLPLLLSETKNGSLPGSDSASSSSGQSSSPITPSDKRSPVQEQKKSPTPPQTLIQPKRKRYHCDECPFNANSVIRLERHSIGHQLTDGYKCASVGCTFMCRTPGFLLRHYAVHEEELPWPPVQIRNGKVVPPKIKVEDKEEKQQEQVIENKSKKTKEVVQEVGKKIKASRTSLFGKALLRSHKAVPNEMETHLKQCNVSNCQFRTTSMTVLIAHKARIHKSKSMFPGRTHLCFTCGHRAKTYADLRVHKLTRHTSTTRGRFHRTYYLKEIIGDKYFIKYYINSENMNEIEMEEADESGDESFDSLPGTSVTPETLAEIEKQAVFCCNLCPYQAPTMNRCQRHHAKHFTPSPFKCHSCSWSSRSQKVLTAHEKLHGPTDSGEEVKEEVVKSSHEKKKVEDPSKDPYAVEMFSSIDTVPLGNSIRQWCKKEKSKRPELDDHFTRKMIDGVKGFQCVECPYTSKYRGDMRTHKKRHEMEQMYRCVQCTYTTNRPVSLKDHMKQHIPVNQSLQDVKETALVVNQGVQIGTRRGVGKDRIYCCNKCPYVTAVLGCLWRHHRNHRHVAKFYICSNCTYSSIDMRKMEEHTVIHTALGNNEQMPFVKRVDQEGNPVVSLTDLNLDKAAEKRIKRKMAEEEKRLRETDGTPAKRKKRDSHESGAEQSVEKSPAPQPTRQPSERATRSKINYSVMSKCGGGKMSAVGSSSMKDLKSGEDGDAEGGETLEETHWKIRQFLNEEYGATESFKCQECPYEASTAEILEQHVFFHQPSDTPRPYNCCDCTFTSLTPTAIIQHLKVHSEGVTYDPLMKKMHKHRKGDTIPAGVKGFTCRTCNYKTVNKQFFAEHTAFHRHQMSNRIGVSMKRGQVKEDYQRPKLKHHAIARNAKYCKKCTFKCVSQSNFIEHVDRHGWKQMYKCYMCDYSDNNKAVVNFHQLHHHILKDQPLQTLNRVAEYRLDNGVIQEPESTRPKPTPEEFAKVSGNLLRCACCEFFCHVASELAFHMSVEHKDDPQARETISYLHMGLVPPQATVKPVN